MIPTTLRLQSIRHHLRTQRLRRALSPPTRTTQEFPKTPASQASPIPEMEVRDLYLVTQRKPLEVVEPWRWLRWLLRRYFKWRGFAARDHDGKCYASIEYRGVFDDPALARWVANCPGGAVKPIPFNFALPEETCSYKATEVPCSEEAQWYRRGVVQPFVAVPRAEIERYEQLGQRIYELHQHTSEDPAYRV